MLRQPNVHRSTKAGKETYRSTANLLPDAVLAADAVRNSEKHQYAVRS
jgi:hypothetical protein